MVPVLNGFKIDCLRTANTGEGEFHTLWSEASPRNPPSKRAEYFATTSEGQTQTMLHPTLLLSIDIESSLTLSCTALVSFSETPSSSTAVPLERKYCSLGRSWAAVATSPPRYSQSMEILRSPSFGTVWDSLWRNPLLLTEKFALAQHGTREALRPAFACPTFVPLPLWLALARYYVHALGRAYYCTRSLAQVYECRPVRILHISFTLPRRDFHGLALIAKQTRKPASRHLLNPVDMQLDILVLG